MVLDYHGDSDSFRELDLLLTSTSALGDGFIQPIRRIMLTSMHVDKPGVEEKVRENLKEFHSTFVEKIQIFNPVFINKVYLLIDCGIKEHCEIYPLLKTQK